MIRRPPRSTLDRSSAASDVYKRQVMRKAQTNLENIALSYLTMLVPLALVGVIWMLSLSLIHISEPTRPY